MPSRPSLLTLSAREATWKLAVPSIALGLLKSGYFLANSFWVSGMGRDALAAIGGVSFAVWALYSMTELAATGVYSQVAQATGAGDAERARGALGQGLAFAVVLALLLSAGMYFGRDAYFDLLQLPIGPARQLGMEFLGVTAFGVLPLVLFVTLTAAFRGIGDTRTPLFIYAATLLFNVAVDPLLIYGIGPWRGMGIAGAASASLLATAIGTLLSWKGLTARGCRPRFNRLELRQLTAMIAIGLPIAASGVGFDIVYVFLGREINRFGPDALAAVGLGHRIESLGFQTCIGFQVAATTLVGQWVGFGSPENAARAAREVRNQMLRVILPASILAVIFAPWFIEPFSRDPAVIRDGVLYLRLNGAVMSLMGLEVMYEGAFSGAGRTLPALMIAFPLTAARIPLAHVLAVDLGMGAGGIWLAIALSTVAKGLLMNGWFARGRWKRAAVAVPVSGP